MQPKTKHFDAIIIGAGAAGLMCAIEAAKRGRHVLVLDHANKAGKKILMSGGGRCNFTNTDIQPNCFISHNSHFCKSALSRYTSTDFINLVKKHQIPFHEKKLGQLFCDNKSKDILNMLLSECAAAGVIIQLDTNIVDISRSFTLNTSKGHFTCQSLVIATGGLSIPTMGASPFGYQVAERYHLAVYPTRAGLVPFTLHEKDKQRLEVLAGVSADCRVHCHQQSFRENMLFTHRGLSGPAMLQISSYWQPGYMLTIDLFPDDDLFALLKQQRMQHNITLKHFFNQYLPKRLVVIWLDERALNTSIKDCSDKRLKTIAGQFQHWQIQPNGTEGYRTAEVTLGGVDTDAISSKTFEVKTVPGLYFIGEVLDVTGWLGGYNFQWAWSSGHAAGVSI